MCIHMYMWGGQTLNVCVTQYIVHVGIHVLSRQLYLSLFNKNEVRIC